MSETKQTQPYSIHCENNALAINGVTKVIEITDREAQLKLQTDTLIVKGSGISLTRLDKDKGVVQMDYARLSSLSFRSGGVNLKGLFK